MYLYGIDDAFFFNDDVTLRNECGRNHYSVCWGPKMERSPFIDKSVNFQVDTTDTKKSSRVSSGDDEPACYSSALLTHLREYDKIHNDYIDVNNIVLRSDDRNIL